jgi:hypothetical protein
MNDVITYLDAKNITLSKNFKLSEFVFSETAEDENIDNSIPMKLVSNVNDLTVNLLQQLRQVVGEPIELISGYRTPYLNKIVGGSKTSDHLFGRASDIRCVNTKISALDLTTIILNENFDFKQLIIERSSRGYEWVHTSYQVGANKRQLMYKKPGSYYTNTTLDELKNTWNDHV